MYYRQQPSGYQFPFPFPGGGTNPGGSTNRRLNEIERQLERHTRRLNRLNRRVRRLESQFGYSQSYEDNY